MNKANFLACALILTVAGCGCGGNNAGTSFGNNPMASDARAAKAREEALADAKRAVEQGQTPKVVDSINDFGVRLAQRVFEAERSGRGDEPLGNYLISPISVSTALSMTYLGANGETKRAMEQTLGIGSIPAEQLNIANRSLQTLLENIDPKVNLSIANSIWARRGVEFNPEFLKRNQDYYRARVETLDFADPQAPSVINRWVSEQTKNRIPTIVDQIPDDAVMYLINAVYFKGTWTSPFNKEATQEQPFTNSRGQQSNVPMMRRTGNYGHFSVNGAEGVSLPYGEGRMSMIVVLPPKGGSVQELVARLDAAAWRKLIDGISQKEVQLALPRWTASYETALKDALSALGMGVAFQPNRADFTGMRTERDLFISQVKHKTFIEVNEEGTEAAAATSVEVGATSAPMDEPVRFVADRPFLYAIREETTGTILFLGIVGQP
jgi:serine protease inhibitor